MIAVSQVEHAALDVVFRSRSAGLDGFGGSNGIGAAQWAAPEAVDTARGGSDIAKPAAHQLARLMRWRP